MNHAFAKAQIEANISNRFGPIFKIGEKPPVDFLATGVSEIDALTGGGLPRGAITELVGPPSSGRTSLLLSVLAQATTKGETCAMIDTSDSFDPASAANGGADFNRFLWVRCGNSLERAFKAADLLLQSGGFGFVALSLAEVGGSYGRRIITSWWFRFRRAIENTPTAFIVISPVAYARSCASVILEMGNDDAMWLSSTTHSQIKYMAEVRLTNGRRISLVENLRTETNLSSVTHGRLLRAIDVQVKLAKPTTWTESSVRFHQIA